MDDDDLFAVEYTAEKAGEAKGGAALFIAILAVALLATYFLVRR